MGMAASLLNRPWPFVQIFNPPSTEGSGWSLKKIGPGVSEVEVVQSCERRTDDDERQVITIAHHEHLAQVS